MLLSGAIPDQSHVPEAVKAARRPRPKSIGGDRLNLGLPAPQIALIETAIASGKPVVVVIIAGSAVLVEGWHDRVGAILQTFYSGGSGGTALARLLFGDVSPSGRLPFTLARRAEDYPAFDRDATTITYDLWHGYAKFARDGVIPRFAFGHGLSYTEFGCRAVTVRVAHDIIEVSVAVTNTGAQAGETPVFAFVSPPGGVERWPMALKAFTRIRLARGETRVVRLSFPIASVRWRDPATHSWRIEPGQYLVHVGTDSDTAGQASFTL